MCCRLLFDVWCVVVGVWCLLLCVLRVAVVWFALFVACWRWVAAGCYLVVVRCSCSLSLFVVCCLLLVVVGCLLFVVHGVSLFAVSCLFLLVVCCLLPVRP